MSEANAKIERLKEVLSDASTSVNRISPRSVWLQPPKGFWQFIRNLALEAAQLAEEIEKSAPE
jgi:hypothetical protein